MSEDNVFHRHCLISLCVCISVSHCSWRQCWSDWRGGWSRQSYAPCACRWPLPRCTTAPPCWWTRWRTSASLTALSPSLHSSSTSGWMTQSSSSGMHGDPNPYLKHEVFCLSIRNVPKYGFECLIIPNKLRRLVFIVFRDLRYNTVLRNRNSRWMLFFLWSEGSAQKISRDLELKGFVLKCFHQAWNTKTRHSHRKQ